ncbi:MAG TPA: FHA domain-containing protein [Vicinamibacterales bacterium]|nr:FHA domain-containing protein [Vicinamibacterales bacterium]
MWVIRTDEGAPVAFCFRMLPGNVKTIGRAPRADFIVEATLVSRLHCRLTAGAAELEVVDLDSTNGTYINGQRVARSSLRNGDRLSVGEVEFVVSIVRQEIRSSGEKETGDQEITRSGDQVN